MKVAAVLLALVLVPCGVVFQSLVSINATIFNPQFYSSIAADSGIVDTVYEMLDYDATYTAIAEAVADTPAEGMVASFRPSLEDIRAEINNTVEDLFRVVDGQQDHIYFRVNAAGIGELFAGPDGQRFLRMTAQSLPACGASPLQAGGALLNPPFPNCRPEGVSQAAFVDEIADQHSQIVANWPPYFEYQLNVINSPQDRQVFQGYTEFRDSIRNPLPIIGVIALLLWLGAAFLGSKDRRGRLRWLGLTLVPSALVVLLLSSAVWGVLSSFLAPASFAGAVGEPLVGSAARGASSLVNQFTGSFSTTASTFIFIAAALIFFGFSFDQQPFVTNALARVRGAGKKAADYAQSEQTQQVVGKARETVTSTIGDVKARSEQFLQSEQTQQVVEKTRDTVVNTFEGAKTRGQQFLQAEQTQQAVEASKQMLNRGAAGLSGLAGKATHQIRDLGKQAVPAAGKPDLLANIDEVDFASDDPLDDLPDNLPSGGDASPEAPKI